MLSINANVQLGDIWLIWLLQYNLRGELIFLEIGIAYSLTDDVERLLSTGKKLWTRLAFA